MGEFYALACALAWAVAVILFRKSGETVPPLALNTFRVVLSSALFVVTLVAMDQDILGRAPLKDYLILIASGIIAIAVSDTLFHMCLNRVGAGINAIIDSLYSPFIVLFAFLLLGERLGWSQFAGMVLIVGGVLLTSRIRPPRGLQRRALIEGILIGAAAMSTLAFGIVIAKPVLERSDVMWATTVRQLGALAALVPALLLHPRRRQLVQVFRPQRSWRFTVPGTVLGSYVALSLWIAGMKAISAGSAAILNQTSTIYILVFAAIFLGEGFSWRKAFSASLAVAGILLVILPGA